MSEEILKLKLSELETVRVVESNGVVTEVPISQLSVFASEAWARRQLTKVASDRLIALHEAIQAFSGEPQEVGIELSLTIRKS